VLTNVISDEKLLFVMSKQKAAQRRRKKNHKYGELVKTVAEDTGRSVYTVYAVLNGRMRSQPIEDAIDSYYRTLELPSVAVDGTGVAQ
jgi:hypothetical protein